MSAEATRGERLVGATTRLLAGGGFAAFALALLATYEAFLVALLVMPSAGVGSFAEEFRMWCYGYDPATGSMQWALVISMLSPPWVLGAGLAWLWGDALRAMTVRARAAAAVPGALLVLAGAIGLVAVSRPGETGDLPFPGRAIRTAYEAPPLDLVDQTGAPVRIGDLEGEVVLLTAVYAHCNHTCPQILTQAKAALAELSAEETGDVRVVAVTLDPERDTPEVLADLADMHGLPAATWRLATGDPLVVEDVLDRMGIERTKDPATGVIAHANLFLLVDREGRVAYRLTLGERQERWLVAALRELLAEGGDLG